MAERVRLKREQLEEDLRRRIHAGEWTAGSMLPSRATLAKMYHVSLGTLQAAVATLLADGILVADSSRGTFVSRQALANAGTTSFSDNDSRTGVMPGVYQYDPNDHPDRRRFVAIVSHLDLDLEEDYLERGWAPRVISALERALARQQPILTQLYNCWRQGEPSRQTPQVIEEALAANPDALLVINVSNITSADEITPLIAHQTIPIIYLSSEEENLPCAMISFDQYACGYQAATHLMMSGYRGLIFLNLFSDNWLHLRLDGAQAAARIFKTSFDVTNGAAMKQQYYLGMTEAEQKKIVSQALSDCQSALGCTSLVGYGIIAPSDRVVLRVMEYLTECQLQVGADVGVIGFDDAFFSSHLGISTIPPPLELCGEILSRYLFQVFNGEPLVNRACVSGHVIPRSSTHSAL